MDEQIKFEMDSDEVFDILKDIGEAENELGKQCLKDGLKAQAIEYFKHEATCEIAIKAIEKTIPMKPARIKKGTYASDIYRCECCKQLIAVIPMATKYCDNCGQRLYWEEEEDATD